MGTSRIKTRLCSEVTSCVSIQIFLGKFRKENRKSNLVAIFFLKYKFDSLLFIKNNNTTTTQLHFVRNGLCSVFRGAYSI